MSADRFWIEHDSLELHTTSYIHILRVIWICHACIKETGHSKITLSLQLNHGLKNSLLIVKHPDGCCPRGGQPHTGCVQLPHKRAKAGGRLHHKFRAKHRFLCYYNS